MIDTQSSAFALEFGSLKGCRKLAGHNMPGSQPPKPLRPGGALEHSSIFFSSQLKIQNSKFKITSASRKVMQAKRPQKNSPFFFGHFDGKSLGNQPKTIQKTPQKHAKNMQFLINLLELAGPRCCAAAWNRQRNNSPATKSHLWCLKLGSKSPIILVMRRGILMIFLASGLAWSAVSRADNSSTAIIDGKTVDLQNVEIKDLDLRHMDPKQRMLLLQKYRHLHMPPSSAMPGMMGMPNTAPAIQTSVKTPVTTPAASTPTVSASPAPANPDNPYSSIVSRNVFGLNPIPVQDPNAPPPGPPPPKINLTGIMTIFGSPEALFSVAGVVRDGHPPQDESYIFSEGEAQDDVEVETIDTNKEVVTFNNHGQTQVIQLTEASASSGSAPAAPSWPGQHFIPRRFGRNFGGGPGAPPFGRPGNMPPQSYNNQPSWGNNGSANGNSSGFGQSFGGSGSYNNSSSSSSSQPAMSADDQAVVIAANHAEAVASGSPTAVLFPATPYDPDAMKEAGLGSTGDSAGPGGSTTPSYSAQRPGGSQARP